MAALNLVGAAVEHKRKLIVKQRLVGAVVSKLFEAMAVDEILEGDADDEDDDSVHKRAAQTLNLLACSVPSKHASPAILQAVGECHAHASAPRRRAAIIGLAMSAEGCTEPFCEKLEHLLPMLYAGCQDGVQGVREAACIGIGEFARHLQPDIIEHYREVLPHIFMVRARRVRLLRAPAPRRCPLSRGPPAHTHPEVQ